jgi:hypothetical protein
MYSYFTSTPLFGGLSILGLVALTGGSALLLSAPPLVGASGGPSRMSLGLETLVTLLPVLGLLCFAFAASPMPTILERFAVSRHADLLPRGRLTLVASAFGTVTLLALLASVVTSIYFLRTPFPPATAFARALPVSLLTYTALYVVLWMIARSRTATGKLVGFAGVVATLVVPLRYIAVPSTSLAGPWLAAIVAWTSIAAAFICAPRLRHVVGRRRHALSQCFGASTYRGGGEVDFLIGTAGPWPFALGQALPVALSAYYLRDYAPLAAEAPANPWLFFMTILSVLSGGLASVAAARSRALWLRARWTRAQLFARVEAAHWRHNACSIGVLLVLLVAVGTYLDQPARMLAFGLGLLVLGSTLSTYLGLMVTTAVGWRMALLAVATMLALMTTSIYAARPSTPAAVLFALELALAVVALGFRGWALRRWSNLDWLRCRPEAAKRATA